MLLMRHWQGIAESVGVISRADPSSANKSLRSPGLLDGQLSLVHSILASIGKTLFILEVAEICFLQEKEGLCFAEIKNVHALVVKALVRVERMSFSQKKGKINSPSLQ